MTAILIAVLILAAVIWYGRQSGTAGAPGTRPSPGTSGKPATPRKPKCRWTKTGSSKGALAEFKCQTCSAVAYSTEESGPLYCKKDFGRGEL